MVRHLHRRGRTAFVFAAPNLAARVVTLSEPSPERAAHAQCGACKRHFNAGRGASSGRARAGASLRVPHQARASRPRRPPALAAAAASRRRSPSWGGAAGTPPDLQRDAAGEPRRAVRPPRLPPPRTPPPGLPRSFSAGRESCAPQPSQWRSRSRLSPATLSPWALGSGSRQPSCSRYFPSRARRLWAATMRKKGRLAQPPRANRITTCPPR